MIQGLVQIFIFQALGEIISRFALPMIPGPVLGLVALLIFLLIRGNVPQHIDLVGSSILQHLGLLFVPATVGVVLYLPLLATHVMGVITALLVSVVATLAVTVLVLKFMAPSPKTEDEHAN
jgi:holin-like protein